MLMKFTRFWLVVVFGTALLAFSLACKKSDGISQKRELPPLKSFQFETVTLDSSGQLINRRALQAQAYAEDLDGVQLEMVEIPAGTFIMGRSPGEFVSPGLYPAQEEPPHRVTIPKFYMGKYEVTQAQWKAIMGSNPSKFKGDNLPVENVSWNDAAEFCLKLSQMTGREYRLPSEAEWEYACRANTTTPFAFGETVTPDIENYNGNGPYAGAPKGTDREATVAVGSLGVANEFGLYDMHGNVMEWCQDWRHDNYNGAPTDGSSWLNGGQQRERVVRGGDYYHGAEYSRSAARGGFTPTDRLGVLGFRIVAAKRTP